MRHDVDRGLASSIRVVSGIPAGEGGTGQLVAHLQERMREILGGGPRIVARPERLAPWQMDVWLRNKAYGLAANQLLRQFFRLVRFGLGLSPVLLRRGRPLILLHPQNLGYGLALRLLESRKVPSLFFLLDSSFFCLASYNHLQGETAPCLRCLELGFGEAAKNGCKPFPQADPAGPEFAPRLQALVKEGRVRVAAQSIRQAQLAQRHFGLPTLPPVVGLWTQDWEDVVGNDEAASDRAGEHDWDVLFHGHCLDAKGASWTANVAKNCPELRFMFPFGRPEWFWAPENCSFVPCTWESGLRRELGRARFVFVPSLWSAPIEGALVKSIACARAVAVAQNSTSYCDELPEGLTLRLAAAPEDAAAQLRQAVESGWSPDEKIKAAWLAGFVERRSSFVPGLLRAAMSE